jgi:hypothetical protein
MGEDSVSYLITLLLLYCHTHVSRMSIHAIAVMPESKLHLRHLHTTASAYRQRGLGLDQAEAGSPNAYCLTLPHYA